MRNFSLIILLVNLNIRRST